MSARDVYVNPLGTRYASRPMLRLFSDERRFGTWRRLWLALARAQKELGLAITAAPIIHLGATSMFVVDNADTILMREALGIVRARLVRVIAALSELAARHAETPCLSYTHFQPAQPTTFGRRVCLWIQDLLLDLEEIERRRTSLRLLGTKGTTGTQASFLTLFDGDHGKVKELDRRVAAAMGFDATFPLTGQTVSRKVDAQVVSALGGIAQSAHKAANDVRLLMGLGGVEEPSKKEQIGSSAMAYKKNPMKCERMTSLARFVLSLEGYAAQTTAEQWLERTLDDSAGKRIVLPEAFLATDAVLVIYEDVARGLVVFPAVLLAELKRELPAMATEEILMHGVRAGGDRQALHESIRRHSREATRRVKEEGVPSDLLARIEADPAFAAVRRHIPDMLDPKRFLGRSVEQVREFLAEEAAPTLERHRDAAIESGEVSV
jgi:adenylosuccinate lyase